MLEIDHRFGNACIHVVEIADHAALIVVTYWRRHLIEVSLRRSGASWTRI